MFSWLETIIELLENIATYVLTALVEGINFIFDGFNAIVATANAALPTLPEPAGPPTIIGWLNWIMYLGTILSYTTGLLTAYAAWLAVKWIFKKAGIIS